MLDSRCHESPTGLTSAKKPSKVYLHLNWQPLITIKLFVISIKKGFDIYNTVLKTWYISKYRYQICITNCSINFANFLFSK